MNCIEQLENIGEYSAAALLKNEERSLFYRKSFAVNKWFETRELIPYCGKKLYPSGKDIYTPYGTYINDLYVDFKKINGTQAEQKIKDTFLDFRSYVPAEHTVAGEMWTHCHPCYERILSEGLCSYRDRVGNIGDKDMRDGLLLVIDGIEKYAKRCVEYLKSENAPKCLTDALSQVPMHPARNFYEAIVCWNFVMYLDRSDNLGCVARGLLPYYGKNDEPYVIELLKEMYNNLDKNDGFSMALGPDYDNPLIKPCLKAAAGCRRPMIELFVTDDMPEDIWETALELTRTGGGQPAYYNYTSLKSAMKERFPQIADKDLERLCGGGCTEMMLAGISSVGSLDAGINLLLLLSDMIPMLTDFESFEDFYGQYMKKVEKTVCEVTDAVYRSQKERAVGNPLPMRTLLVDDCIDNGRDFNNGGARYAWSTINCAGIINVIDSLLVIRDFVFEKKYYTAEKFIQLLSENNSEFLDRCRKYEVCYGVDDKSANQLTERFSRQLFRMFDGKETYYGSGFVPASINFDAYGYAGSKIAATPDGRQQFSPIADSLAPVFHKDTVGPTAMLNSVTSIDLKKAVGIPVLNFTVSKDFDNLIMKALILGYIHNGGMQIQVTCADEREILDAYEHPEEHRNLIVRVGGYSEYFNNLPDDLKRAVIKRTFHSLEK